MTTKIYKNYQEFTNRENKKENGVSQSFVEDNPKYQEMNESNEGCWNCSYCRSCSSCSSCNSCSDCSSCSSCNSCSYCRSCSSCSSCNSCSYCRSCSSCRSCSYCSDCSEKEGDLIIPKIENIHQKILEAVTKPDALEMKQWHTCDTTHCRAGWAVVLAGKEGKELEAKTSSLFAGMVIFNKSSDIKVPLLKFFDTNEKAMEDIKKCAELEKKG